MKSLISIIASFALATNAVAQTTAATQPVQFRNTSFPTSVSVGFVWPISWTIGNGLPVSLSLGNGTWTSAIFVQRPVLPSSYTFTFSVPAGTVSGNYQLVLSQIENNAGITYSPYFAVVVSDTTASVSGGGNPIAPTDTGLVPTATGWVPVKTMTVTYVYYDHKCGCTKTTSAASPLGTGVPHTTYSWYEDQCGCTKSAVVPVAPTSGGNNYTAPLVPPVISASGVTSVGGIDGGAKPAATTEARNGDVAVDATTKVSSGDFTGDAVRMTGSTLGMVALFVAAVIA